MPYRRSIRRQAEKLGNGSQRLSPLGGLYICQLPVILKLLELLQASNTHKNISKPTQVHIDHNLRFSTSFESTSARLALE